MKYSLTMFCVGGDRVLLTHSGDAEDPLRMVAKASPDSKTVEFDLDLSDGTQDAHMRRVIFTVIDATTTPKTGPI